MCNTGVPILSWNSAIAWKNVLTWRWLSPYQDSTSDLSHNVVYIMTRPQVTTVLTFCKQIRMSKWLWFLPLESKSLRVRQLLGRAWPIRNTMRVLCTKSRRTTCTRPRWCSLWSRSRRRGREKKWLVGSPWAKITAAKTRYGIGTIWSNKRSRRSVTGICYQIPEKFAEFRGISPFKKVNAW